jgi:hypothetical protein
MIGIYSVRREWKSENPMWEQGLSDSWEQGFASLRRLVFDPVGSSLKWQMAMETSTQSVVFALQPQ